MINKKQPADKTIQKKTSAAQQLHFDFMEDNRTQPIFIQMPQIAPAPPNEQEKKERVVLLHNIKSALIVLQRRLECLRIKLA